MGLTEDLIDELVKCTSFTKEQLGALLALTNIEQTDPEELKTIFKTAAHAKSSVTEVYRKIRDRGYGQTSR